eukprot:jgi/Ulvmu1/9505/UM052_0078.1
MTVQGNLSASGRGLLKFILWWCHIHLSASPAKLAEQLHGKLVKTHAAMASKLLHASQIGMKHKYSDHVTALVGMELPLSHNFLPQPEYRHCAQPSKVKKERQGPGFIMHLALTHSCTS